MQSNKVEEFKKLREKMLQKGWYKSPPTGSLNAKYMFIGIRPGRTMQRFTKSNKILEPLLERYVSFNYYFTNVVKYPDDNNTLPTDKEAEDSIGILKEEIALIKPDMIIALGTWVFNTLAKYGIQASSIPHPSYISRMGKQKDYEKTFIKIFGDKNNY